MRDRAFLQEQFAVMYGKYQGPNLGDALGKEQINEQFR